MKLKKSVTYNGRKYPAVSMDRCSLEIFIAADIVDNIYKQHGYEAIVSAGCEQTYEREGEDAYLYFIHATTSKHNVGDAIDVSGKNKNHVPIPLGTIDVMDFEIKSKLKAISDKYVVIFHKGHFHIQFNRQ